MSNDPDVLRLPRLLDEGQVASALGCSTATVKRERQRGRLGFTRIGGRIRYTEDQVAEYLYNQRQEPKCVNNQLTALEKSADFGSASRAEAPTGAEHGSIRQHDRHAAHLLAQQILSKPSSRSPTT